ncbi:LysR family transcriptional regulator [Bordetella hinzii]|uniref:LysR family transcriptional regulator n=2 Tax=Bordetella hinzii TaxID=103855 RepID=A0AAN1RSR2_9BORD|nr:LysR family transcriptional regulator [Bordetella hinzii]AKQ54938.1 Hca operon transcriptional activator [Bordetella hinzii]AKQ59449.1 Hca operon transcriptional activator [Bordetella hinzii]AZW15319.1 LysR family transcriptional regulator [Bordetella hinzii]KCB24903.1 LysR substrate-binding domain protein [Bordetella hinzii OH87 BAL007II]KCB30552.1 LysR substrate-binding domain protein [Bordetella hinzii L60]
MNLRQLSQFIALAETGNFHRAAAQLHMAQPPLSISIRKLEAEVGSALFERTSTGVFLTPAGQAMLADARAALLHADKCRQAVRDVRDGEGGRLRLGFIGSATYDLMPRLIPSLRERYPKVALEFNEATSSEILAGLRSRELDMGLLRYPVLEDSGCVLVPMDRDDFMLAVNAASPLAARDEIALGEAAHEPFIMYPRDKVPSLSALARMRCEFSGFTPQVAQEAMQVQTIMSLVASGLGVGLVAGVSRLVQPRGVKCLRLTDNPPGFQVGIALARAAGPASRLIEHVIQHALSFRQDRMGEAAYTPR